MARRIGVLLVGNRGLWAIYLAMRTLNAYVAEGEKMTWWWLWIVSATYTLATRAFCRVCTAEFGCLLLFGCLLFLGLLRLVCFRVGCFGFRFGLWWVGNGLDRWDRKQTGPGFGETALD